MSHMKELTDLGFLVDETAVNLIEGLDDGAFVAFKQYIAKENPFMVKSEMVCLFTTTGVKIIKNSAPPSKFTVQDIVKCLNERYSALQNLLLRRVEFSDLVSINKLGGGASTIIGLVKDKAENGSGFLVGLEDSTGTVQTSIPKALGEKLSLDDVVAVSGKLNNKVFFADKVVFPDVPIRPVNYSKSPISVSFLDGKDATDSQFLIKKDRIIEKRNGREYNITQPSIAEIDGITVLILLGYNPLDVLKKRYVGTDVAGFVVDPIPDVIFTDSDVCANYKGITIVPLNKTIDLKTRQVIEA